MMFVSRFIKRNHIAIATFLFAGATLYILSRYNYLLYHGLIEIASIVIAFGIFIIAWHAKDFFDNDYFVFIGLSYLFVGGFDILHTLAYRGMNVFKGFIESDLATQLWLSARFFEALSFLLAIFFIKRRLNHKVQLGSYSIAFVMICLVIFLFRVFPAAYIEAQGLTTFKIISEYIIIAVLLTALFMLIYNRKEFDHGIFLLVSFSIVVTVLSEIFFTLYSDVFALYNNLGHIFKLLSFFLLYKAIIETGFNKPLDIFFHNINSKAREIESRERQFKSFFNSIREPAMIFIASFDEDDVLEGLKLLNTNYMFDISFGIDREELVGKGLDFVFSKIGLPADDVSRLIKRKRFSSLELGSTMNSDIYEVNFFNMTSDRIAVIINDITKEKIYEEKIESISRFARQNPNPVMRLDSDLKVTYANKPAKKILKEMGYGPGNKMDVLFKNRRSIRKSSSVLKTIGSSIYKFDIAYFKDFDYYNIFGSDITKKISEERSDSKKKRDTAVLDERRKIAGDLHDTVTQILFSANLLTESIQRSWRNDPDKTSEMLDKLKRLNRSALYEMRLLLYELRPSNIAEKKLEDLLKDHIKTITGRFDISIDMKVTGNHKNSFRIKKEFYRIAQEAFNNITKHSKAKSIEVLLLNLPDRLEMSIKDDGIGFEKKEYPGSYGLKIMEERAAVIGASLKIESVKDKGTIVILIYNRS